MPIIPNGTVFYAGTSDPFERNLREDYMKPGFEKCPLPDQKKAGIDRDLDGEIYAEQLHSLLQRISPEMEHFFSNKRSIKSKEAEQKMITAPQEPQRKASDEEKIWNAIHGNSNSKGGKQLNKIPKTLPERFMRIPHAGGVFEGAHQGPKLFSQSVMVQTVRKPDGSYETRRTIRDADGQTKTTVTRSMNGKTETITSYGNEQSSAHNGGTAVNDNSDIGNPMLKSMIDTNRNLAVTKGGYLLPNNLWWLAMDSQSQHLLNILILNIIIDKILAFIISVLCGVSKYSSDVNEINHYIIITKLSWKLIRGIQFKQLIMFVLWFKYSNVFQIHSPDR